MPKSPNPRDGLNLAISWLERQAIPPVVTEEGDSFDDLYDFFVVLSETEEELSLDHLAVLLPWMNRGSLLLDEAISDAFLYSSSWPQLAFLLNVNPPSPHPRGDFALLKYKSVIDAAFFDEENYATVVRASDLAFAQFRPGNLLPLLESSNWQDASLHLLENLAVVATHDLSSPASNGRRSREGYIQDATAVHDLRSHILARGDEVSLLFLHNQDNSLVEMLEAPGAFFDSEG